MSKRRLTSTSLDAVSGGAIDFNWNPDRRETIDPVQQRRNLDNDYWNFSGAVRDGREAMDEIERNNGLIDNDSTPDFRREVEDANRQWQEQLDGARERIDESNELQMNNGREPWSEDMVPTPDEQPEYDDYENIGSPEAPVYET